MGDFFTWGNIKIFLQILNFILVFLAIINLLRANKSPAVLVSWFFILIIFPFIGVIIYIYAGINWRKKKIFKNNVETLFEDTYSDLLEKQSEDILSHNIYLDETKKNINLVLNSSMSPLTTSNDVKLFFTGKDFFDNLCKDLEKAEHSISLEFYIWRSDKLGEKVKDILIKKAKEGVSVRIVVDSVGSINKISQKYRRDLKKHGIKLKYFLNPFSVINNRLVNFRNHRKIVVIDSKIAYSGGMNLGQEYITGGDKFDEWVDCQYRVEGAAVSFLNRVFYVDWMNSDGDSYKFEKNEYNSFFKSKNGVQVVYSGPDTDFNSIEMVFLSMISNAEKNVYIQSPYFIPSETLSTALQTAALSGIDVKIMLTGVPDKKLPFLVAETYFEKLIASGVDIFRYNSGFLHSKIVIADDVLSTVGTCNFDLRSFHTNYEVNSIFYNKKVIKDLTENFFFNLESCEKINFSTVKNYSFFRRILSAILKVVAPLL